MSLYFLNIDTSHSLQQPQSWSSKGSQTYWAVKKIETLKQIQNMTMSEKADSTPTMAVKFDEAAPQVVTYQKDLRIPLP